MHLGTHDRTGSADKVGDVLLGKPYLQRESMRAPRAEAACELHHRFDHPPVDGLGHRADHPPLDLRYILTDQVRRERLSIWILASTLASLHRCPSAPL